MIATLLCTITPKIEMQIGVSPKRIFRDAATGATTHRKSIASTAGQKRKMADAIKAPSGD
jgi:hypothetical protein